MRVTTLMDTVEAAYRLVDHDADWLKGIGEASAPILDEGFGVIGWMFDPARPASEWLSSPITVGADPGFCEAVLSTYQRMPVRDREGMYLYSSGIGTSSEMLGAPAADQYDPVAPFAMKLGFQDFLGVRAMDPLVGGCVLGAALRTPRRAGRSFVSAWGKVTAHIAAGLRLRRALAAHGSTEEAVLDGRGKVHHAEGEARTPRNLVALRNAARNIDRARGKLAKSDPLAAVSSWRALTAGKWSLVDRFEADGKHFLVARTNEPDAVDPRALSRRERVVCKYAAAGHSNKLIAYSLDVSEGTVSGHLARSFRKLGVSTRVELIGALMAASESRQTNLEIGGERLVVASSAGTPDFADGKLTSAEREVAAMAVTGKSNAAIAAERGSAERTVANLLASVYRKLGVTSRAELTALKSRK